MMKKQIVSICVLGLLLGLGVGCKRKENTGSGSFSFRFDIKNEEELATVEKMYQAVGKELEERDFRKLKMTETLEKKSTQYEGEYDAFPLTVEVHYLLQFSTEEPEFYYRVSFKETSDVEEVKKAIKDFRVLIAAWSENARK